MVNSQLEWNYGGSVHLKHQNLQPVCVEKVFLAEIVFLYSSFKIHSYKHFNVFTLTYSFPGIYIYTLGWTSDNTNPPI